jgi:hypothetical protein
MTADTMIERAPLEVEDGEVLVYRLFDVADAVDLQRVEEVVSTPKSRLRLERAQSASALEFPRPPVQLAVGARALPFAGGPRPVEATARIFDYGVISVCYRIPVPPGTPLGALLPLAEQLFVEPAPGIDAEARREAEAIAGTLGEALERPHAWEGLESYQVFLVRRWVGGRVQASTLLAGTPIPELLLGETSDVPLSAAERRDVLAHHLSYLEDDLAVVHWNSAFVSEPSGVNDIPDLLEFATAHLLELRYYDALLDRELHRIYDEIEAKGSRLANIFTPRYRTLQRRTAALLLELSEMTERLENAVKIVGDFYLARLYQTAVQRFRLPAWQETVLRKQRLVAEVNDLIGEAADTSRGELLELAVILLIVLEIVAALR